MSTSRVVLLMLLLNIVTVGGGVGAAYWLLRPGFEGDTSNTAPASTETVAYEFYPVSKVIVGVRGKNREHYFVLDLALQARHTDEPRDFADVEPLVRNSVVSYLSNFSFDELRALKIVELQDRLEEALFADFATQRAAVPFEHVLINKLIVQ